MKSVKYSAVTYCSSEKSQLTGQPGFGIRAMSEGLDESICDAILAGADADGNPITKVFGYELSEDRKLVKIDSPDVVKGYPISYSYREIPNAKRQLYAFARTVYIGVDYGYFSGRASAQRVGSNYFSHILLFEEKPPREIFSLLESNNCFDNGAFLPLDNSCTPENSELVALLSGEPQRVPTKEFVISDDPKPLELTPECARIISALVQRYLNQRSGVADKKIIIKSEHVKSAHYAAWIKTELPAYLVDDLSFQVNFNKGLPKDIDMIFVNEHFFGKPLYESANICVDLLGGSDEGIDKTPLFDKIKELVEVGDSHTLLELLNYLPTIEVKADSDLDFIFKRFLLELSDLPFPIEYLTPDLFKKLAATNFSSQIKSRVWSKISRTLESAIYTLNSAQVSKAIDIINDNRIQTDVVISAECKSSFTKFIFDIPYNFGEIVNARNVETTITLISKSVIGDSERLFRSLQTTADFKVWAQYVRLCVKASDLEGKCPTILDEALNSSMIAADVQNLIDSLYPNSKSVLIEYLLSRPQYIMRLSKLAQSLCRDCNLDLLVRFVTASKDELSALEVLEPIVNSYFIKRLSHSTSCVAVVDEYLKFVQAVTLEVANALKSDKFVDKVAQVIFENPSNTIASTIEKVKGAGLIINSSAEKRFAVIMAILSDSVPSEVTYDSMIMTYKLGRMELLPKMFDGWLLSGFSDRELVDFIKKAKNLSDNQPLIVHMVQKIWECPKATIAINRESLVTAVVDNCDWQKPQKMLFLTENKQSDVVKFINKSSSFINKLLRKFKK